MAVFTDLPSEIVSQIFGYLAVETEIEEDHRCTSHAARPDLCALSRVNRFYGKLAGDLLYRDVNLWYCDGYGRYVMMDNPSDGDYGRPSLLLQSIQDDKVLNQIQNLTLDWNNCYADEPKDARESLDAILHRMSHSTSLAQLDLTINRVDSKPLSRTHSGAFTQLRQVILYKRANYFSTAESLLDICCLPVLRHLSSCGGAVVLNGNTKGDLVPSNRPYDTEAIATRDTVPRSAALADLPLQSLDLVGHSEVLEDFFSALLPATPQLQRLASPIFGPGCRNWRISSSAFGHFRPKLIQSFLEHVKLTLQKLTLVTSSNKHLRGDNWLVVDKHDGTTLDLRGFTNLYHVNLSTYLLCDGTMTKLNCQPEINFYQTLPASLKSLEIEIAPFQGILYDQQHLDFMKQEEWPKSFYSPKREESAVVKWFDDLFCDDDLPGRLTQRLDWLFRLLSIRKSQGILSELRRVRVYEARVMDYYNRDRVDLVSLYPELFTEYSDIDVKVTMRDPGSWQPVHRDPIFGYAATSWKGLISRSSKQISQYLKDDIVHDEPKWTEYLSRCEGTFGLSMIRPADSEYYDDSFKKHDAVSKRFCPICFPYRYSRWQAAGCPDDYEDSPDEYNSSDYYESEDEVSEKDATEDQQG